MTHAEYVAQGYEPIYGVSEAYEVVDKVFAVDVYDWSKPKGKQMIEHHEFEADGDAQAFEAHKTAEVEGREVDTDWDDPIMEYQGQAMNELAAGARS